MTVVLANMDTNDGIHNYYRFISTFLVPFLIYYVTMRSKRLPFWRRESALCRVCGNRCSGLDVGVDTVLRNMDNRHFSQCPRKEKSFWFQKIAGKGFSSSMCPRDAKMETFSRPTRITTIKSHLLRKVLLTMRLRKSNLQTFNKQQQVNTTLKKVTGKRTRNNRWWNHQQGVRIPSRKELLHASAKIQRAKAFDSQQKKLVNYRRNDTGTTRETLGSGISNKFFQRYPFWRQRRRRRRRFGCW